MLDAIDPEVAFPHAKTLQLNLDDFLEFRVAYVDGHFITVKDVIRRCAHVEGGVHFGEARTEGEKALGAVQDFEVNGVTFNIRQLLPMLRVVRKALVPLEEKLRPTGA